MSSIKHDIGRYYDFWFAMNDIYERWASSQGVTSTTLYVLMVLDQYKENSTLQLISDKKLYPKQTVNAVLNSLEKDSYVVRVPNRDDKRKKNIVLTNEGITYTRNILDQLYQLEEYSFSEFTESEREEMLNHNDKLVRNFNDYFNRHNE